MLSSMNQIVQKEGVGALFNGLGASMLGLTHVLIYFPLYETTKRKLREYHQMSETENLGAFNIFLSAIFSKSITSGITYPHEVIRARSQDHRKGDSGTAQISSIIKSTFQRNVWRGFYHGFMFNIARMIPQNAIVFTLYETISYQLHRKLD